MSYAGADIASLRFLAANVVYQTTGALLRPESGDEADRGVLDDAVLMMDVIASYFTEKDPQFAVEWTAITEERHRTAGAVKPGFELDPSVQEAFRWRELKAMFRSLCRQGNFVRQEATVAEWVPNVAKNGKVA